MKSTQRGFAERLHDAARGTRDLPSLASAVYAALAGSVPFDFACLAATDPATGLITWTSKTRSLGTGDEEFAAVEYGPPDVNSFAEIGGRQPPVGVLSIDTRGDLDRCRRHRDFLAPRFGFTDELRTVFASRGASWGALAMYRAAGDAAFTAAEAQQIGEASELVAEAIQRVLFTREATAGASTLPSSSQGPAVLIVDASDRVTHATPGAEAAIAELGGWEFGSLPATVLAVVATTRTHSRHTDIPNQARSGRWLSVRAAPLSGPSGSTGGSDVVVTIEPTPRSAVSRMALAAHGLTAREEEVSLLVLQGASTAAIASTLHLSPYTVQDHLKTVFTKLGVTSRREMTARLVLT